MRIESFEDLARTVAMAFTAYSLGMSLEHAQKQYEAYPTGPYWLDLVKKVEADLMRKGVCKP
jgi:hypothetical protein